MKKSEISFNENLKSCEAPPVAFNINSLNIEKNKKYKIAKNSSLAILSKSQNLKKLNYELSKLKIDISPEVLKSMEKNNLLDIIIFIQNYCSISLISNNFIFNNPNFEINQSSTNPKNFTLILSKNKINNDKIISEKIRDFYCSNHNRHFKSNEALQNHIRATHKFICDKCGVYFINKIKLLKHKNKFHQIQNNNNDFINIKNYSNNNNIIINDNNELKNKEREKKINKLTLLFEAIEKESQEKKLKNSKKRQPKKKNSIQKEDELKLQEKFKQLEERKRKEEELKKKEEELKRQEEELKRKEEERKRKEEELKRQEEERKRKEEERKRQEELRKFEELKRLEKERKKKEELRKKEEIKNLKNQNKPKSNQDIFYECYLDNKRFNSEKEYINHFSKYHNKDYPFYCDICKKGFFSFQAIENHNFSKNH